MTKRQKKVKKSIEYLKKYMETYDSQFGYLDYTDETIIDDIIYGLGVCIDEKEYQFADGFQKFKKRLAEHISPNKQDQRQERIKL